MRRTDLCDDADDYGYDVSSRITVERSRPARRYAPRYAKQSAPAGCQRGMQERGKRRCQAALAAA